MCTHVTTATCNLSGSFGEGFPWREKNLCSLLVVNQLGD